MSIGEEELLSRFTWQAPNESQIKRYEQIRKVALGFASLIDELCPDSREKSLATTELETVVMWANAAIARRE